MLHSVTNLTCSAPLFVFTVNQLSDTLYYDASKAYLARALLTAYNFCLLIKLIERQNIHFRLSLNVRVAGHYGVRSIVDAAGRLTDCSQECKQALAVPQQCLHVGFSPCSSTVSTWRLLSMFLNSVYMKASLHVPQQCLHGGCCD
eukprot:XP_012826976.1 PREDICTED: coiled-coil domain containing 56 isoform X1 [Xenopus tropicalis]